MEFRKTMRFPSAISASHTFPEWIKFSLLVPYHNLPFMCLFLPLVCWVCDGRNSDSKLCSQCGTWMGLLNEWAGRVSVPERGKNKIPKIQNRGCSLPGSSSSCVPRAQCLTPSTKWTPSKGCGIELSFLWLQLKYGLCSLGYRMTFLRRLTWRCHDKNDQYFKTWRAVRLSSWRESEVNLIAGSGGIKMSYKTDLSQASVTVPLLVCDLS